jgi:glucoamylase
VGTAYAASSRVWFTLWRGIVTEVYYPTVDRPQIRDLQFLLTDGKSFLHEEKRHMACRVERLSSSLGYRVTRTGPEGRYGLTKEIICDPHSSCVLQHVTVTDDQEFLAGCKLYVLCAPHMDGTGRGNNAFVIDVAGRECLVAHRNNYWMALAASCPFSRLSCGYVGQSDGWTDLAEGFQMDWEFDRALDGNVALTGEIDLAQHREFTLALAFGDGLQSAVTKLFQGLGIPFARQCQRFVEQWERADQSRLPLEAASGDQGGLYSMSYSLLLAHEDKTYQGAVVASLSIPWGQARGDAEGMGGYHLVWTRDMVNSAMALLAAGNTTTPLRALMYLAASQLPDGGFPQNFWTNGEPFGAQTQLDETAFPILLASRLHREKALQEFDPQTMVMRAAAFLVSQGPVTPQERWEEAGGFSPSTLAAVIAALICAACFAREHGEQAGATFLEEYADYLRSHLPDWTITRRGTLLPEVKEHFVRINPNYDGNLAGGVSVDDAVVEIGNRPPGAQANFPASEVVDAGFLELVRYGIFRPDDPRVVKSLRVVDHTLKVDTPFGPCWHRYNNDGYGQQEDGGAHVTYGKGRAWPLLTGERGHYELAAGHDVRPFLTAMERFASDTGLLSEQIWDESDLPRAHMRFGRPTGAAMPLLWAHSEYIKLLRSAADGKVFDRIPEVADRYLNKKRKYKPLVMWTFAFQPGSVKTGETLRVYAKRPFHLRWSIDEWQTQEDSQSLDTSLGIHFTDIEVPASQELPVRFTFFWPAENRWEDRDFTVLVK